MKITKEVKASIDNSILCWLATVSRDAMPNVSPKQIFNIYQEEFIIVANIASPQTVKNIKQNSKVCISFIDILVQKGYQIKGMAEIILPTHNEFPEMEKILLIMTNGKFPFSSITRIKVEKIKEIVAPSYRLYPDTTTEEDQIEGAKKIYGLR